MAETLKVAAHHRSAYPPDKWTRLEEYNAAQLAWEHHVGKYLCQSRAGAAPGLFHDNNDAARGECLALHEARNAAREFVGAL